MLNQSLTKFPPLKMSGPRFFTRAVQELPFPRTRLLARVGGFNSARWAFYGHVVAFMPVIALLRRSSALYGECMARSISTTVRLGEEDLRALKRARAAGLSASDLIRKGLRVVASRYYSGRRPPSTLLFESTSSKLGDESELFRNIED